ncbi:MAG: hypothetical protein LBF61_02470 [Azoarcus sp.]|jgi:hypothetical protein|nr:hypothetical protein [Azoarcus sp.]
MPGENKISIYDELLAGNAGIPVARDAAQSARLGFFAAQDANPDAYAEVRRVARSTGLPVDTVLNQPNEVKRRAAMNRVDFDALAQTAPATAALLADLDRARLAHDDVYGMGQIERKLRQGAGGSTEGAGMALSGIGELLDIANRRYLRRAANIFLPDPRGHDVDPASLEGPRIGEGWLRQGCKRTRADRRAGGDMARFARYLYGGHGGYGR